ncbi:hypothetical protein IFT66_22925 [Rhizobium sp. CFBP 13726]|nr:hypothetical protein [Rhizobium sp. CFBP 13726]
MATVSFVFTIDYVAEILDEDVDLLREIISNDDNLTYGRNIISVVTGDDESTPALTDHGIDELRQMLTRLLDDQPKNGRSSSIALSSTKRSPHASRHIPRVVIGRLRKNRSEAAAVFAKSVFDMLASFGVAIAVRTPIRRDGNPSSG